jgi:hypothetical protein
MRFYLSKAAAVGFLTFLALWIAGTVRGLTLDYPMPNPIDISSYRQGVQGMQNANNLKDIAGLPQTSLPIILDAPEVDQIRIHEKRAFLAMGSANFKDDETAIRKAVKDFKAEIFTEFNGGIEPSRRVTLEIGVNPERFDDLVATLQTIGKLSSITVEKKDRTGEFRNLFAKRQSLKNRLAAILKLTEGKNPSLEDALKLEAKIHEIEKELQALNVQFGDLLGKESYYHVHVTLVEHQPGGRGDRTYTLPQRIGHAFVWALVWWFGVVLAFVVFAGAGLSMWVLTRRAPA